MSLSPADASYARGLVAAGVAPEAAVRLEAQAALAAGLGLREHLLRAGRITPEQDARAHAALTPTRPAAPALGAAGRRLGPVGLPRPGATVAGHVIERELARGGAGAVFVARDAAGQPVALKVLLAGWRGGAHAERFRREAELGERLDHPGIVKVLAHGEDDGRAWLAMELLEGALPLDEFAAREGLDARARVELVVQVCEALQHAHEQGAIHRDLKPQNVLVSPAGRVKVVDLGLARLLDEERLTKSGATMGTLEYMAPEQVRGDTAHADARTDVYALGVVLFELLAGAVPFTGETPVEVMCKILGDQPPDLARLAPGLPRGLAAVVTMALSRAPDARHPTAVALGRDLAAVLAGNPESSTSWSRARAARGGRRLRAGLVAALALLLVSGAAAAGWALRERLAAVAAADLRRRLDAGVADLLGGAGALRADGPALAHQLALDRAALEATGRADPAELAREAARLAAVEGLVALAAGDEALAGARLALAAGAPEAPLLAGALAAVISPTPAALTALEAAIAAGARRPELSLWRAACAAAVGPLDAPAARRALEDLELAGTDGDDPAPGVRLGRARALLVLGRLGEVEAALGGLPPPSGLVWALALAEAERALAAADLAAAEAALAGAPAGPAPAAARAQASALAARLRRDVEAQARGLAEDRGSPARRARVLSGLRLLARLEPEVALPRAAVAALLDAACAFSGTGDLDAGEALAELVPDDFAVQRGVGLLAERNRTVNLKRRSLPALRRAVALAPPGELPALGLFLCALLSLTGEYDECLAACERFLPAARDDEARGALLLARGRSRRALGALDAALRDLSEAARLLPADHKPRYERALAHRELGQDDAALEDAREALLRTSDNGSFESDRMVAYIWDLGRPRGDAAAVRQAVEHLLRGRPLYSGWWLRLALLQLEAGEGDAAQATLARAAALFAEGDAWLRPLGAAAAELQAVAHADAPRTLGRLRALVEDLDARRGPTGQRP